MHIIHRTHITAITTAAAALLLTTAAATAQVLYVDDDAPPGGDGATWSTAHRFLQEALAHAAEPGSDITEIRVAQGVYKPDQNQNNAIGSGDRDATFALLNGVSLLGGYAGIGAPDPDERRPDVYVAQLSGNLGVMTSDGDDSYHVVSILGHDGSAALDGFAIRDGSANLTGQFGGGMLFDNSTMTISNCRVESGWALDGGGGVGVIGSEVSFVNCQFVDNLCHVVGGALHSVNSQLDFQNCLFFSNLAAYGGGFGGALHLINCDASFVKCNFIDNRGDGYGGDGGAVYAEQGTLMFAGCTASGNWAQDNGGMLHAFGCSVTLTNCDFVAQIAVEMDDGGIIFGEGGSFVISDCTFSSPDQAVIVAKRGAGLFITNPTAFTMNRCDFVDLHARFSGGGCRMAAADEADFEAIIVDCSFSGCVASPTIPPQSTPPNNTGGGLLILDGRASIVNCSFVGNSSRQGAALETFDRITIDSCHFEANEAISGVVNLWEDSTVSRSTFTENEACGFGILGAIRHADVDVVNCTFADNSAILGGVFWVLSGWPERPTLKAHNCLLIGNRAEDVCGRSVGRGGAAYVDRGDLILNNCTIALNSAEDGPGGGIYLEREANLTMNNSILWNNADGTGSGEEAQIWIDKHDMETITVAVNYSIIDGLTGFFGGVGNSGADPMFIDLDGPDDNVETLADNDYHLLPMSPAIDAGWNTVTPLDTTDLDNDGDTNEFLPVDLDDQPRFVDASDVADTGCGVNAIVDIGAYEFQGPPGAPLQPTFGDVDGNMQLDSLDLVAMLNSWGECVDDCCVEDINADGVIDIFDLLTALGVWE